MRCEYCKAPEVYKVIEEGRGVGYVRVCKEHLVAAVDGVMPSRGGVVVSYV